MTIASKYRLTVRKTVCYNSGRVPTCYHTRFSPERRLRLEIGEPGCGRPAAEGSRKLLISRGVCTGKPFGVLLGGILIGTIFNGLSILNVSSFYQKIALGSLIIFALALEKVVSNISAKTEQK